MTSKPTKQFIHLAYKANVSDEKCVKLIEGLTPYITDLGGDIWIARTFDPDYSMFVVKLPEGVEPPEDLNEYTLTRGQK